jgi:hypothetical protein
MDGWRGMLVDEERGARGSEGFGAPDVMLVPAS